MTTRVQRLSPVVLGGAVFLAALLVLWFLAAPSVTFHDSGEFALAAASAGIPHPPGAPTWTLLASAFLRLGHFADPARGTNLFSALGGAVTLGLLSGLVQAWTRRRFPALPVWAMALAGLTPALLLLSSPAFLEQATTTEQYTLLTALLAALWLVILRLAPDPAPAVTRAAAWPWLLVLGLLWGLAAGNHLSQLSLGLLAAGGVIAGARRDKLWRDLFGNGAACAAGFGLGALIFLWVPLRARTNPLMDWGHVATFERFVWAVTRQQWTLRPLAAAPRGFMSEWIASYDVIGQLGVLGVVLAIAGVIVLFRRHSLWLFWLAAATIPYMAGLLLAHMRQDQIDINYIRQYGLMDWHLPLYAALAVSAGMGVAGGLAWLAGARPRLASVLPCALLLALLASAACAARRASLRHFSAPDEFIRAVLAPLPREALILVGSDNLLFMLSYNTYLGAAPATRWVACDTPPTQREMISGWSQEKKVAHLRNVMLPGQQPLHIPALTPERAAAGRLFTAFSPSYSASARWLLPAGLLFEVRDRPVTDDEVRAAERRLRQDYPGLFRRCPARPHRLEREAWFLLHEARGAYFVARGLWPEAAEAYERAVEWCRTNGNAWYCLADVHERLGQMRAAAAAYGRAIQEAPYEPGPRTALAILLAQAGVRGDAEKLLREELEWNPGYQPAQTNLQLLKSGSRRHK
ncbi:MAG: DUF2723 domain-containing protein [Kiritimatiellaeota bacterium]|nr:DUF2723 domain-containing protein [Kiritimatiellota bacterium]